MSFRKPIKELDYSKVKEATFKGGLFAPIHCELCQKKLKVGEKYLPKKGREVHVSCLEELKHVA